MHTWRTLRNTVSVLFVALLLPLLAGQGCPAPGGSGANQPPNANAGFDQTVAPGETVTLSATGIDPDGDPLTFQWTQVAGTPSVMLTNADTAMASFTAPPTAAALTFQVAVDDGRGGTGTDTANVTVTALPPPTVTPRLFIANSLGNNVTSYTNPSTINGNIAPDTNLAGASTQLSGTSDIVVDAAGALLAVNVSPSIITSYNNASATNGNLAPNRNVQGTNTQLSVPVSLAINSTNDILFVSKLVPPAILIYTSVSGAGFTGDLAPTRVITTTGVLIDPVGINLDSAGNLYVANGTINNVLVYANAANLNGNVAPTRTITGTPAFTAAFDVFIDKNDRMFVVNAIGGRINVFNNASARNGTVAPDLTLTIPGAGQLTAIAVDSAGRGYVVEYLPAPGRIYSYDSIGTLNGTLPPDRTIAGTNTQLSGPIRMFLVE